MRSVKIPEIRAKLVDHAFEDHYYGYQFALCDRYYRLTMLFNSCREVLISELSCLLQHSVYAPKDISQKDLTKTRLLIGRKLTLPNMSIVRKEHHKAMLRALRVVNHFERIAKWPPTKLFKVSDDDLKKDEALYLFVGDKRWIRAPYIISMYALLIRLGRWEQFGKFRSHPGFIEACKEINKKDVPMAAEYDDTIKEYDIQFIGPRVYMRLKPLMKYFSRIFGSMSTECYYLKAIEGSCGADGIGDLCLNKTCDKKLEKRFITVCNKYAL